MTDTKIVTSDGAQGAYVAKDDALETGESDHRRVGVASWFRGPHQSSRERQRPWWQVVSLTGVDYFSSLGYQPGIAALAAGILSPLATVILIVVTLGGALPVYRRVARESFNGQGSIAMLENLLPRWGGKLVILILLGFAITDFVITITLSTSDAAAHVIGNPLAPGWLNGDTQAVIISLVLILGLAAVFLKGFGQAIWVAIALVSAFLVLNAVVLCASTIQIASRPVVIGDWWHDLGAAFPNPAAAFGVAVLVFPQLALGLSGFETGVAVAPAIQGDKSDTPAAPTGRIRGTKRLLACAAIIMSVLLVWSSLCTILLIPITEFSPGGAANGRALSFLAHQYLGSIFGSVYDLSTIAILWFAGASAMAGLLNLIPRYLPRYGMAPRWAAANRPLVVAVALIACGVIVAFGANVDAQGGAYGTGVLALITSAAVAVTLSAVRHRERIRATAFGVIALAFIYTTVVNVIERSDGIRIAALFILGIIAISLISRIFRAFELRATSVVLDPTAEHLVQETAHAHGRLQILAIPPQTSSAGYGRRLRHHRHQDNPSKADVIFLEVHPGNPSDFEEALLVTGAVVDEFLVLRVTSGNVPNTIASVLLAIRDTTGVVPDAYFSWTTGRLVASLVRYLFFGAGEVALVTREVLLRAEHDEGRRPDVHAS